MKKFLGLSLLLIKFLFADTADVSETLGHHIIGELKKNPEVDVDKVIKGMHEAAKGQKPPLSEEAYQKEILEIKEKQNKEIEKIAFEQADLFLQNNVKEKNIVEALPGKLQYEILAIGKGKKIEIYNTPLIRLKGYDLSGKVFYPESETLLSFDDLIPDLNKIILSMKEAEKRKIYLHPSLGFFKDTKIYPKKLLIFEIEIIKADKTELATHDISDKKIR